MGATEKGAKCPLWANPYWGPFVVPKEIIFSSKLPISDPRLFFLTVVAGPGDNSKRWGSKRDGGREMAAAGSDPRGS